MKTKKANQILTYSIAAVWLISGLMCKVLNLVPRHQEIVERILGSNHARLLTILIGIAEIFLAVWILTGFWSRSNAIIQIIVVAAMNTLEFVLAPDLLLWGRFNAVFAIIFIVVIFYNEFHLGKKLIEETT